MDEVFHFMKKPRPIQESPQLHLSPTPPPLPLTPIQNASLQQPHNSASATPTSQLPCGLSDQPSANNSDRLASEIASILSGPESPSPNAWSPMNLSPSHSQPPSTCNPASSYTVLIPMDTPIQCAPSLMPGPSRLISDAGFSVSVNPYHNSPNMGYANFSQPGFPNHHVSSTQSAPSRFGGSCCSLTTQNSGEQQGTGPFGLDSPAKMVNKFPGRNTSSLRELTVALARNVVILLLLK